MKEKLMKLRPLPATDLARFAPLAEEEKKQRLETYSSKGGSWSYAPATKQATNIFNPTDPLGLKQEKPSLDNIISSTSKACTRGEVQEKACIEISSLLYNWVNENIGNAIERPIPSMPIGTLGSVRYWEDFAALYDSKPTFFFFDCRRSNGTTELARRFIFSMMHQQIRMTDPDFSDAGLTILTFPQRPNSMRRCIPYTDEGVDLIGIDELQEMTEETYELWYEILRTRRDENTKNYHQQKTGTGDLFG